MGMDHSFQVNILLKSLSIVILSSLVQLSFAKDLDTFKPITQRIKSGVYMGKSGGYFLVNLPNDPSEFERDSERNKSKATANKYVTIIVYGETQRGLLYSPDLSKLDSGYLAGISFSGSCIGRTESLGNSTTGADRDLYLDRLGEWKFLSNNNSDQKSNLDYAVGPITLLESKHSGEAKLKFEPVASGKGQYCGIMELSLKKLLVIKANELMNSESASILHVKITNYQISAICSNAFLFNPSISLDDDLVYVGKLPDLNLKRAYRGDRLSLELVTSSSASVLNSSLRGYLIFGSKSYELRCESSYTGTGIPCCSYAVRSKELDARIGTVYLTWHVPKEKGGFRDSSSNIVADRITATLYLNGRGPVLAPIIVDELN
jgi:hypothetical protein